MVCEALEVGENNLIVTAHPDDEVLWCGGLPIHFFEKRWTILCCSRPKADPERKDKFFAACAFLDAACKISEYQETESGEPLRLDFHLEEPFDMIFTHNAKGEYGHSHHKSVHEYVRKHWPDIPTYTFCGSQYTLRLDEKELAMKIKALGAYNHQSPLDTKPKWEALLERYFPNGGFDVESYDRA